MPAPSYLNTGFVADSVSSDDVQDAMDLVADVLTSQLAVDDRWSDEGSDTYETPTLEPASAARKFSVQLTRDSQTQLKFHVRDQHGITVLDGEMHISGTAEFKVFAGPHHLVIQAFYGGTTYECCIAAMSDPRPQPLATHPIYVFAKTWRDSDGNAHGWAPYMNGWAVNDADGNAGAARVAQLYVGVGQPDGRTSGGSNFHLPLEMLIQPSASSANVCSAGKMIQLIHLSAAHDVGTVVAVPIDEEGGVGYFEVLGQSDTGSNFTGRLGVRTVQP